MAETKKLARAVAVDGEWYQPGAEVPPEVAKRITNPKAWMSDEDRAEGEAADGQAKKKPGTAGGARLARTVHVDGAAYGPNDPVPDDVAERITNPKAWEGGKLPGARAAAKAAPAKAAKSTPAKGDDSA